MPKGKTEKKKERFEPYDKDRLKKTLERSKRASVSSSAEEEDASSDEEELEDDDIDTEENKDEKEDKDEGSVEEDGDLDQAQKFQRQVQQSRHPTLYTYMGTRPTSQLSLAKQGPHTVSFCAVSLGISKATEDGNWPKLQALFQSQVESPEAFENLFDGELSKTSQHTSRHKIARAKQDYREYYEKVSGAIKAALEEGKKILDYDEALHGVRALMEMHPFQTYGWKGGGKKASQSSIKGKSEAFYLKALIGGDTAAMAGLMDMSRVKTNQKEQLKEFLLKRIKLVLPDKDENAIYKDCFG
jgi:hypothetical protein